MEEGTDTEHTSDKPGIAMSQSGAGRSVDLVKDALESLIEQVVEKCENANKSNRGRAVFSEEHRMRLEQHFSVNRRITGEIKNKLMADLKVSSKQVENWFRCRRRAQDKLEALRAEEARRVAITWPLYKLNNSKPSQVSDERNLASMQVQEVREVQEVKNVSAYSGKDLLEELEGNVKEVERRALDRVAMRPIPLLAMMLSRQEVKYCMQNLHEKGWDLGSKAAFLLALTDQVRKFI